MAANRRSYYRILHVQPEAPTPVITASYRTMMSKLRLHPDLGGDTEGAALINEAYAVLSDPERRAGYDARLKSMSAGRRRGNPPATASATATATPSGGSTRAGGQCPLCAARIPAELKSDSRCLRCQSPLAPAPNRPAGKSELFGRRAIPRMSRSDTVTVIADWRQPACRARLRDLSISGISVVMDARVDVPRVIRVIGEVFDVTARVVGSRVEGRRVEVHAELMTAIFMRPKGGVVSLKA